MGRLIEWEATDEDEAILLWDGFPAALLLVLGLELVG